MDESVKKAINTLIEDSKSAVVCSLDEDGFPNAKKCIPLKMKDLRPFGFQQIYRQYVHNNC